MSDIAEALDRLTETIQIIYVSELKKGDFITMSKNISKVFNVINGGY